MSRGFSLTECVVASLLCAVGLMGVAAGGRASLDLALVGHRDAGAATVAAARLASLRAAGCGGTSTGEAASGAFIEHWAVATSNSLRQATVDVAFAIGSTRRTLHFTAEWTCRAG